jgi:hypothetical protein
VRSSPGAFPRWAWFALKNIPQISDCTSMPGPVFFWNCHKYQCGRFCGTKMAVFVMSVTYLRLSLSIDCLRSRWPKSPRVTKQAPCGSPHRAVGTDGRIACRTPVAPTRKSGSHFFMNRERVGLFKNVSRGCSNRQNTQLPGELAARPSIQARQETQKPGKCYTYHCYLQRLCNGGV